MFFSLVKYHEFRMYPYDLCFYVYSFYASVNSIVFFKFIIFIGYILFISITNLSIPLLMNIKDVSRIL